MIISYDLLGHDYPDRKTEVLAFLRQEAKEKKLTKFSVARWILTGMPTGTLRQTNAIDCGVYICVFAETLTRGAQLEGRKIDPDPGEDAGGEVRGTRLN